MDHENRRHKRFDVTLEVEADVGKRTFPGRVLRLSQGGCLVEISLNLGPGEQIHLKINEPGALPLRVKGEVRSVVGGVGLGIKFLDLSQGAQERIRGIIYKKYLSESRAPALTSKRQDQRVALGVPVRIRGIDIFDEAFEENTVTENVSPNGACVSVRHFLNVGAKVDLEAFDKFRAQAVVRFLWINERSKEYFSIGLQFVEIEGQWILK